MLMEFAAVIHTQHQISCETPCMFTIGISLLNIARVGKVDDK